MPDIELARAEAGLLRVGDRVGHFRVIRWLDSGASAEVYEGEHAALGRRVAIKVVRRAAEATAQQRARFRREARTCGALIHPHIAEVLDAGHTEHGDPYL